jgi:CheY-like chemotaxis protein
MTSPLPPQRPAPIPRDILKGWTVLILEDDPDSMDVALRVLRYYGATTHPTINGQEALIALKTIRPRFIISDLAMPVMSGWDFIAALRKERQYDDIPVIALTAHGMSGDREKAFAAGFYNYLTKPLTASSLIRDLLVMLNGIPEFAADLQR